MPNDYCLYILPSKSFHVYWGRPFSSIGSSVPSWTRSWNCFFFHGIQWNAVSFMPCLLCSFFISFDGFSPSSWSGEWRNPLPLLSQPPSYTFTGSLVLCVLFFFFLSSLKAMGIIPVLLLIHYFNKCALSTFSMQQYSYKWTKSVLREFIPLIRNVFNRLLNKQLKHIEYHMKNSAMKNWSWRGNTMKELW